MDKNSVGASTEIFDLINWQINKTETRLYLEKIGARLQNSGLPAKAVLAIFSLP